MACKGSRLVSTLPCPAGRSVPGRGGPERRRRPRPDGTGAQRCGGYTEPAGRGVQRARTVTMGAKKPQLRPPAQTPLSSLSVTATYREGTTRRAAPPATLRALPPERPEEQR